MTFFKNIFERSNWSLNFNFHNLAKVRKAKMMEAGMNVESINWDLYVKILEAKHELNRKS